MTNSKRGTMNACYPCLANLEPNDEVCAHCEIADYEDTPQETEIERLLCWTQEAVAPLAGLTFESLTVAKNTLDRCIERLAQTRERVRHFRRQDQIKTVLTHISTMAKEDCELDEAEIVINGNPYIIRSTHVEENDLF